MGIGEAIVVVDGIESFAVMQPLGLEVVAVPLKRPWPLGNRELAVGAAMESVGPRKAVPLLPDCLPRSSDGPLVVDGMKQGNIL